MNFQGSVRGSAGAGRTGGGAPPRRVRMDSFAMVLHWVEGAIGALDVVSEVPAMWRERARIVDGAVTTRHVTPPDHERIGLDLGGEVPRPGERRTVTSGRGPGRISAARMSRDVSGRLRRRLDSVPCGRGEHAQGGASGEIVGGRGVADEGQDDPEISGL